MVDIIILFIILGTACMSAKTGFIKSVFGFVSSLVALGLTLILYPLIESILKWMPIDEYIREWVIERLPDVGNIGLQGQAAVIEESLAWMPKFVTDKMVRNNNPEIYQLLGVDSFVEYIGTFVANLCLMGISVIVCFIFVRIALAIGVHILDLVAQLPVLKTVNKWAGFLLGLMKGSLVVWLICLVIPLVMMIPKFEVLGSLIEKSVLMQFFYNHNIILQIITYLQA